MVKSDNGGLRFNEGKPMMHLIPPEIIWGIAEHYTRGAKKYAARNWERGMEYSKCYDSLMRHTMKFWGGEDIDPENGAHHMIAAAWNALAIYVYVMRGIGIDDRPVILSPETKKEEEK